MDRKTYDRAVAHHELKIDELRYASLKGFSLEQRIRLNLQAEFTRSYAKLQDEEN